MGRMMAALYDRTMRATEDACLRDWRAGLVADLKGEILEVGSGTGLNLPFYPSAVTRLVMSEPDPHMRQKLLQKVANQPAGRVEVSDAGLDRLPMAEGSFDAVVSTLVLCSVPDLDGAIAEVRRVLRPGGRFVFLEHVAADDRPNRLKWQRRVEPFWKWFAGGCHLTRRTEAAIAAAGFEFGRLDHESMRKAWPLVRPTILGVAIKPG